MDFFKNLSLRLKFFFGSLFYLTYAHSAYLYSRKRDRLERQFAVPQTKEGFDKPGKLLQAEPTATGAHFYFEQTELEICFLAPDLVRVDWLGGIPAIGYAISRQDWQEVETTLEETGDAWAVSSNKLAVTRVDGSLKFCNSAQATLREQMPLQRQG
jgi:alpha-glucosidase